MVEGDYLTDKDILCYPITHPTTCHLLLATANLVGAGFQMFVFWNVDIRKNRISAFS